MRYSQAKICMECGELNRKLVRTCSNYKISTQSVILKSAIDALVLPAKISYRLTRMLSPKDRNGNGGSFHEKDKE